MSIEIINENNSPISLKCEEGNVGMIYKTTIVIEDVILKRHEYTKEVAENFFNLLNSENL